MYSSILIFISLLNTLTYSNTLRYLQIFPPPNNFNVRPCANGIPLHSISWFILYTYLCQILCLYHCWRVLQSLLNTNIHFWFVLKYSHNSRRMFLLLILKWYPTFTSLNITSKYETIIKDYKEHASKIPYLLLTFRNTESPAYHSSFYFFMLKPIIILIKSVILNVFKRWLNHVCAITSMAFLESFFTIVRCFFLHFTSFRTTLSMYSKSCVLLTFFLQPFCSSSNNF